MTQQEQAFHEKYIKGINLKLIFAVLIPTITIMATGGWYGAMLVNDVKNSIKDSQIKCTQYTDKRVDTLSSQLNQKIQKLKDDNMQSDYDLKLEIEKAKYHRQTGYYTEKYEYKNGKRIIGLIAHK